jgi:transposase
MRLAFSSCAHDCRLSRLDIVALESAGGFETIVAAALTSAGIAVAVVNPVRRYAPLC